MEPTYRFIHDPGHGWLEVPAAELVELAIAHKVSAYSYLSRDGATAYLEEDCDASLFADAKGWPSLPDTIQLCYEDERVLVVGVRNLQSYRPQAIQVRERNTAVVAGTEAQAGAAHVIGPRWVCKKCGGTEVQISLPAWHRESADFELTYIETDTEAEPMYWWCESCQEGGRGQPDEIGEPAEETAA